MDPQQGNRSPSSQPSQVNRPLSIRIETPPSTPPPTPPPTSTRQPRQHPVLQYLPGWLITCGKYCYEKLKSFGEYCRGLLSSCREGCYEFCSALFCHEDSFKGFLYLCVLVGMLVGIPLLYPVIDKALEHILKKERKP